MSNQIIKIREAKDSKIIQVGGDYIEIVIPATRDDRKPIYFIYGDSDVQLLLYQVGTSITEKDYYDAMEQAFRLLVAFKPYDVCIVIAASSVIQSILTYNLFHYFRSLSENVVFPHFYILRRERDWKDYIEKRRERSADLIDVPRFAVYFDKNIEEKFKGIPTLRREVHAGIECSRNWTGRAESILKRFQTNVKLNKEDLSELTEEILVNGILVWEEIEKRFRKIGISIPNWSIDLQTALVNSYLAIYPEFFQFPTGINLSWEICPISAKTYYTNIRLLYKIIEKCGIYEEFFQLSAKSLLKLLENQDMLEYKYKLEMGYNAGGLLHFGYRHRDLIIRAIKSS